MAVILGAITLKNPATAFSCQPPRECLQIPLWSRRRKLSCSRRPKVSHHLCKSFVCGSEVCPKEKRPHHVCQETVTLSHVSIEVADPENCADMLDVSCLPRRLLQLLMFEILNCNRPVGVLVGGAKREAYVQAFTSSSSCPPVAVINLHLMFSRATLAPGASAMST